MVSVANAVSIGIGSPVISNGVITGITVVSGGSGFTAAPTVSITDDGGGSGATATASISGGSVTSVSVTSGGSGYTASTKVFFLPDPTDLGETPDNPDDPTPTEDPDGNDAPTETPDNPSTFPEPGSILVRIGNISTAAYIPDNQALNANFDSLGKNGMIMVGYTVVGAGDKNLLLTGKGHTEADSSSNLIPAMSDPQMEVWAYPFLPADKLADPDGSNDDWGNSFYQTEINSTNFFNQFESKYAGGYPTITGGAYVSVITSVDGASGNVRGETYETYQMGWPSNSASTTKLTGVSTNGWITAGTEPGQRMTAGVGLRNFDTDPNAKKRLICMGKGLAYPYNDPLNNPRIEVSDLNQNLLASNNSWKDNEQDVLDAIEVTGLMNGWGDDNAALIITVTPSELPFSSVLVKLFSEDGDSGGGIVEVYDLDLLEATYGYDVDNP